MNKLWYLVRIMMMFQLALMKKMTIKINKSVVVKNQTLLTKIKQQIITIPIQIDLT